MDDDKLVEDIARFLGMFRYTFKDYSATDAVKAGTFALMSLRNMGAEEATEFIRTNRETINQAMMEGELKADLDALDTLNSEEDDPQEREK